MKKILLACSLLLLIGSSIFAQGFQGKAYYESKTSIDFNFGGRPIPEDRKKRILERMKQMSERSFILSFNPIESIYKEDEKLEQPGMEQGRGHGPMRMMMGNDGGDYYKDIKRGFYSVSKDLYGKIFLIRDSLPTLNWQMAPETKKIGQYTVYKATAVRTVRKANPKAFMPPEKSNEKKDAKEPESIEKEIQVTAWYCPEIPVNQGPGEYWGLPGLIMELNDGTTSILCSKLVINPKEHIQIKEPTKGKKVSQEEYDTIARKKLKEMRENFRRMRPGGGRH